MSVGARQRVAVGTALCQRLTPEQICATADGLIDYRRVYRDGALGLYRQGEGDDTVTTLDGGECIARLYRADRGCLDGLAAEEVGLAFRDFVGKSNRLRFGDSQVQDCDRVLSVSGCECITVGAALRQRLAAKQICATASDIAYSGHCRGNRSGIVCTQRQGDRGVAPQCRQQMVGISRDARYRRSDGLAPEQIGAAQNNAIRQVGVPRCCHRQVQRRHTVAACSVRQIVVVRARGRQQLTTEQVRAAAYRTVLLRGCGCAVTKAQLHNRVAAGHTLQGVVVHA